MSAYNNAFIYVFIYVRHYYGQLVCRFLCNQRLIDGDESALCSGTNVQTTFWLWPPGFVISV